MKPKEKIYVIRNGIKEIFETKTRHTQTDMPSSNQSSAAKHIGIERTQHFQANYFLMASAWKNAQIPVVIVNKFKL